MIDGKLLDPELKKLKEEANPDCPDCFGEGVLINLEKARHVTVQRARQVGKTDMFIKQLLRPCPRCFGPDGKPRDRQKVKK